MTIHDIRARLRRMIESQRPFFIGTAGALAGLPLLDGGSGTAMRRGPSIQRADPVDRSEFDDTLPHWRSD